MDAWEELRIRVLAGVLTVSPMGPEKMRNQSLGDLFGRKNSLM